MTSQSSIVKKMSKFLDEMIHIVFGRVKKVCYGHFIPMAMEVVHHVWVVHLHGHRNKMVIFMKPSIFVNLNNGVKFNNYTCWSTKDIHNHRFSCRVNKHHIGNKYLVFTSHADIGS
jgi:hypothetical protein